MAMSTKRDSCWTGDIALHPDRLAISEDIGEVLFNPAGDWDRCVARFRCLHELDCLVAALLLKWILTPALLFFFQGNGATEDCCSKCFLELQKKQTCVAVAPQPKAEVKAEPITTATTTTVEDTAEPMDVDESPIVDEEKLAASPMASKKKKKKTSYKAMMQSMTKPSGTRDAEKDKETIRKATGGGAFSKIDKI
jgi:hypothetical protein